MLEQPELMEIREMPDTQDVTDTLGVKETLLTVPLERTELRERWVSLDKTVPLEMPVPLGCPEGQAERVTLALTAYLDVTRRECLATLEIQVPWEVEVFLELTGLTELLVMQEEMDTQVTLDPMDPLGPAEMWEMLELLEEPDIRDPQDVLGLVVSLAPRALLVRLVTLDSPDCLAEALITVVRGTLVTQELLELTV